MELGCIFFETMKQRGQIRLLFEPKTDMAPPLIDIIHRSFVLGLVGISGYGFFMGWRVHEDTLQRGRGAFVQFLVAFTSQFTLRVEVRHLNL